MRQMKDSGVPWIGEIPSEWDIIRNKYLFNYVKGKIPESLNCEGQGIVYIGASDLEKNGNSCEYSNFTLEKLIECSVDDTLILWDGARAGTIGTGHKGMISSTIVAVRARNEKINPKYLYWYFKAFQPRLVEMVSGTTIPHMSKTFIENIMFLSLPTDLQTYISIYLDQKISLIDNIIEKTKQSIEEYKKLKQSIITEAVTKGLNPDVKMKDSGIEWIGMIPEHWDKDKIRRLTYVKGRIGWQGLTTAEFIDEGPYLVTGTDFEEGLINWENCVHISLERYEEAKYIQLQNDDLLITKDGTIGKVAIVKNLPDKASLNSGVFVTRPLNNRYISKYLYYVMISDVFWKYFQLSLTGNSTILHLYQNVFEQFWIPLPSLEEQELIVNYVDDMYDKITESIKMKENLVIDLESYKKSLIYEVVTGKKEIA